MKIKIHSLPPLLLVQVYDQKIANLSTVIMIHQNLTQLNVEFISKQKDLIDHLICLLLLPSLFSPKSRSFILGTFLYFRLFAFWQHYPYVYYSHFHCVCLGPVFFLFLGILLYPRLAINISQMFHLIP